MIHWYTWFIAGLALLIVELCTTTMFLIWIACGAFLGGLAALVPGIPWWAPWVVFAVSSFALVLATRPLARRIRQTHNSASNVDALVGRTAIVLQTIDPAQNTGRVRVGSDEWRARCSVVVPEGSTVSVSRVEGTTLIVDAP